MEDARKVNVLENREIDLKGNRGTQNENNVQKLEINIPLKYEDYNKKIVFMVKDGIFWDNIGKDGSYFLKNNITKYDKVKFYIWLTKDEDDFRSVEKTLSFNDNQDASNEISEEEIGAVNKIINLLEEEIIKATGLEARLTALIENVQFKLDNGEFNGQDYVLTEEDKEEIASKVDIQNGQAINSLQQKFESESWTTTNEKIKEYIKNDIANDDGNKIVYEDLGNEDYSIKVITNGKSAFNQNGKGQTVGGKSHTEGSKNIAFESNSHAEGNETFAGGKHSHAEGNTSSALGNASHSEGFKTIAVGIASHTEGSETKAPGDFGHAEGALTQAINSSSHAEGLETISSGLASHTEGGHTEATQDCSHAEGYYTHAIGQYTHAEGCETIAKGGNAHAEGRQTHAEGWESHAEGGNTYAAGGTSHAEGDTTVAIGGGSHAEGYHTVAVANHSHAEGRYNEIDEEGKYVHIVGNGYYDEVEEKEVRSNAHTIDWYGNGVYKGGLKIHGEKDVATTEYVDNTINEIEDIAERAETIAKGRATGYVFDTIEDLELWLQNSENISKLVLGDNLYIRAVGVPDYWWDGTEKQQLETQKVDLTEYVKNTDYATSSKAGLMRPANGLFVSGTTGALLIAKASNAQIDARTDNYYPIVSSNLVYAVESVVGGHVTATQAEYDKLVADGTIDENTYYYIREE